MCIRDRDGSITLPGGGTVTNPGGTYEVPGGTVVDPDGTIHLPNGDVIHPDGTITRKNTNTGNSGNTSGSMATPLSSNSGLNTNNSTLPQTGDDNLSSAEAVVLGIGALIGVMTLTGVEVKRRKEN